MQQSPSEDLIERAMQKALLNSESDLEPVKETMALTRDALQKNQTQIDSLIESISAGGAQGALWTLLNERATRLKAERDGLLMEQRRLQEALAPLADHFDAGVQRSLLLQFTELAGVAEPEELQRLLRLMVRCIEWGPDGSHRVQFYHLQKPNGLPSAKAGRQWFETMVCNDIPLPHSVEPLIFESELTQDGQLVLETARIRRISRREAAVEAALVDTRLRPAMEKLQEPEVA